MLATRFLVLLSALAFPLAVGCNPFPVSCDRDPDDNPVIDYRQGITTGDVYMTSDWAGKLLYWPGGIRYRLITNLHAEPTWIIPYLSFSETGDFAENGTIAQAAGNQVEVLEVAQEDPDASDSPWTITLTNGACAQYWLLVSAGTGEDQPTPP